MGIAAMDILCCRITIGDADPSNPMRIQNGVEITEVQSLEINESYKKLIGTAKVIFPKGSVCRSTIIGNVTLEGKDVSRITTEVMQDGVIIEKRSAQRLVDETTFKVGQRINIKLGYNGVLKNMFDGYITGYNSDSTLEIQCENMAYKLKLKQAPHFETPAKGTTVNEVLEGKYNILKDTGFRIHSDTKRFEIHIGKVKVTDNFTVADILSEWSKYKVYCFLKYDADDDGAIPSIAVGRPYSSSKAQPVFPEDESTGPYRIYFNEHVAQSNLKVVKTDPKFLAVTGKALGTDEKFFEVTVRMNPEYDPATKAKYAEAIRRLKESGLPTAQVAAEFGLQPEAFRSYLKEHEPELYARKGMVRTDTGGAVSRRSMEKYSEAMHLYGTTTESVKSLARRFGFNDCSFGQFIRRNFPELVEKHNEIVQKKGKQNK